MVSGSSRTTLVPYGQTITEPAAPRHPPTTSGRPPPRASIPPVGRSDTSTETSPATMTWPAQPASPRQISTLATTRARRLATLTPPIAREHEADQRYRLQNLPRRSGVDGGGAAAGTSPGRHRANQGLGSTGGSAASGADAHRHRPRLGTGRPARRPRAHPPRSSLGRTLSAGGVLAHRPRRQSAPAERRLSQDGESQVARGAAGWPGCWCPGSTHPAANHPRGRHRLSGWDADGLHRSLSDCRTQPYRSSYPATVIGRDG